jgi:hypothetical protein
VLTLLTTTFWAAVTHESNWNWIGTTYFLTVAVCWAVLIPSKFWPEQRIGDGWGRRLTLMGCGACVGLLALWLDGWNFKGFHHVSDLVRVNGNRRDVIAAGAGFVSYYALALGLVRWWRLTERRRKSWFSLFPVIAAGFWSLALMVLLLGLDDDGTAARSAMALITAAAVVQFVSPHEPPPVMLPRRLRYRPA